MELQKTEKLEFSEPQIASDTSHDQDIIEWIIFSGKTTEKELAAYLNIDAKNVKEVTKRLQGSDIIKVKSPRFGLGNPTLSVNYESQYVKELQSYLKPTIALVDGERRFMTSLDLLKDIIDKYGHVEVGKAAIYFNTTETKMEKLASILQEQKLITLNYPIIGSPVMMRIDESHRLISKSMTVRLQFLLVLIIIVWFLIRVLKLNI